MKTIIKNLLNKIDKMSDEEMDIEIAKMSDEELDELEKKLDKELTCEEKIEVEQEAELIIADIAETEIECKGKDLVDKGIYKFMKCCEQNDYNFNPDEKNLDLDEAEGIIIEAFCLDFTYFSDEEMSLIESVENVDFKWGLDEDGTTYVV